jgi:cysteinyl-tRNA synthetase
MHNGMVQMGTEKMAKSVGNIRLLHVALEQFGRDALLMYFLGGHYRQPLAFSEKLIEEADRRVHRVRDALRRVGPGPSPADMAPLRERFFAALAEDFNTPMALAAMFDWIREANRRAGAGPAASDAGPAGEADLREMLSVLGFENLTPLEAVGDPAAIDPVAAALLERREEARANRDYAEADRLRDEIRTLGWEIRDGPEGAELVPAQR